MDEKKEKFTIIDEFDKEREAEIITLKKRMNSQVMTLMNSTLKLKN